MDDLFSLMDSDGENSDDPSFKNMLLIQISKLKNSNDPLDKQLRSYLLSIIKDKGSTQQSWLAEIEEVEKIHKLVKKGNSLNSAIDFVAKTSKHSKSSLQEIYAEYEDALKEIDQIFIESKTQDSE